MSILFINGSPNKNGNTAKLAETLMSGKAYQTLNLVDYKVYGYGQNFADDQFTEIVEQMKAADTIVIGSPVYWHNMSGMVRNLIDRFYGPVPSGALQGRKFVGKCFSSGTAGWFYCRCVCGNPGKNLQGNFHFFFRYFRDSVNSRKYPLLLHEQYCRGKSHAGT